MLTSRYLNTKWRSEFTTVLHTFDCVSGLHIFQELSLTPEYSDDSILIRKRCSFSSGNTSIKNAREFKNVMNVISHCHLYNACTVLCFVKKTLGLWVFELLFCKVVTLVKCIIYNLRWPRHCVQRYHGRTNNIIGRFVAWSSLCHARTEQQAEQEGTKRALNIRRRRRIGQANVQLCSLW